MITENLKRFWAATCAAALLAADPGLLAAAAILEGVEVGSDEVTIHLNEKVKFNAFTTSEPPRLVLELLDTEHVASTEYTPGSGRYLKRVRSGQYQREPDLISRVVLYLSDLVAYRASWDDSRLKIGLVASDLPRKAAAVAAAVAAPAASSAEAAPAPSSTPAAQAPRNEAVTLDGVDVDADGVTIRLSGKTKFDAFTTEDPPRLVVELSGTRHATLSDYIPGKGGMIRRVRSGQFQPEPDLTSRVVLYLEKLAGYSASWKGNDLRVSLARGAVAPVPVVADAVPPPVIAGANDGAEPAPKKKTRDSAQLPETMTTSASSELERIARAKDYDRMDETAGNREAKKAAGSAVKKPAPVKLRRDIISTLPTDPVTLDFDDMEVRDILKLLATKAKINLVYGNEVSGSMTLHLRDVPFNEAFMTTLSMQGLIPVQVGENILRVVTPGSLAAQRAAGINQTKVIKMRYAQGNLLLPSIQAIRAAENRTGVVAHDPTTNSLVITDSLEGITSLERMLAELDVRPQQILIEAKLVEVTLTKDVHFGIQWDYFSEDRGTLLGQTGRNFIGTPVAPAASPFSKPFDQGVAGTFANPQLGASGRGTGVGLPANAIAGALTLGRVTNNYFLNATITAAANRGKAKVLSDPKVTTLDGRAANINITTQIPYVTSSVSSTGVATEAVSFVTTGIQMAVTPTINADGRVHLLVNPTVSQPSATAASAGSTGAPAVDARSALTNVMVRDGETIVIGGLITDQVNDTVSKVPLLGDLPLLGWLFKKKSKTRTRVELLIFVTTRIVNT